jgi:hypothetical protein
MRAVLVPVVLSAWLAASSAQAQEAAGAKVPLQVDVVQLSNQGAQVEPPALEGMKKTFARQGIAFSSFRQLSTNRVEVQKQPPTELKLPNGKTAQLTLQKLEKDPAEVKLAIPGLIAGTVLRLGKQGTVYQQAGTHQGGKLVLVIRPAR